MENEIIHTFFVIIQKTIDDIMLIDVHMHTNFVYYSWSLSYTKHIDFIRCNGR